MKQKRTPWFDGKTKPARVGLYERKYAGGAYPDYWDGSEWRYGSGEMRCLRQSREWRGLAKDPNHA